MLFLTNKYRKCVWPQVFLVLLNSYVCQFQQTQELLIKCHYNPKEWKLKGEFSFHYVLFLVLGWVQSSLPYSWYKKHQSSYKSNSSHSVSNFERSPRSQEPPHTPARHVSVWVRLGMLWLHTYTCGTSCH